MERIIIWGTGNGFLKYEDGVRERYEIIAFTGNQRPTDNFPYTSLYIEPEQISSMKYDKIMVASKQYFYTIQYQLVSEFKVPLEKIIPINRMPSLDSDLITKIYDSVKQYIDCNKSNQFLIRKEDMWLIADDYQENAGELHKHYFAQDIWAARKIIKKNPKNHFDIGSRLDGFIAHLLSGLERVNYIDIRPLPYQIDGLHFMKSDATNLENIPDNTIESLSSLHAVEHFGLGRYGDPIEPAACFKAMVAFQRVLAPGGRLYFAVPIGPEDKLCFNAHRIFKIETILKAFSALELVEFSIVDKESSNAILIEKSEISKISREIPNYSCGLFEFEKKM